MAKRGNGEGSISQYGGRWMARLTLPDGRRRSLYGKTRAEAAAKLAQALRERDAGLPVADGKTQLGTFLHQWLEESVKPRNRPSTFRSYEGHVRVHLIPELGRIPLAQLSPQHVERLQAKKLHDGLSPATVVRIRATLRRALAQAEKHGLVQRNAAALADPPSVRQKIVKPLTPTEAGRVLNAVEGHRLEALFVLALATGLRQGEILGLYWGDIDLEGNRLTVNRALQKVNGELTFIEPKTDRSRRELAFPKSVRDHLVRHRERQQLERLASLDSWEESELVFTTLRGKPLDGTSVTGSFQLLLAKADLPKMRFHDLRHACASFLLSQGVSMRMIMEQLGHSSINLTMNTYSHILPGAKDEVADKMGQILEEAGRQSTD